MTTTIELPLIDDSEVFGPTPSISVKPTIPLPLIDNSEVFEPAGVSGTTALDLGLIDNSEVFGLSGASATTNEITIKIADSPSGAGTVIDNAHGYMFQDVLNDTGVGTFLLQNDDAQLSLCAFGSYVQWFVDGEHRFTTIIERTEKAEVAPGEEGSEATQVEGRGLVAEWESATVIPELGFDRQPYGRSRLFGFASPHYDDSSWGYAYQQFRQDDPSPSPDALWGRPDNAPDPFIWWIWGIPPPAQAPTPPGLNLFRKKVYISEGGTYRLAIAADNQFYFFVDGLKVGIEYQGPGLEGWQQLHECNVSISEGWHTFAAEVVNAEGVPETNNAGFYCFMATVWNNVIGLDDTNALESDEDWKALAYPEDIPGFTYGQVIRIILEESAAASKLSTWTLGFTDTLDSDGTPWPVWPDITVRVGDDLLTMLRQFAESGIDFAVDPSSRRLDAWVKGNKGTASGLTFTTGVDVLELKRDERAPIANRLQIEYYRGVTEVLSIEERDGATSEETYGPIRKRLDLTEFHSITAVQDYLYRFFEVWAWPQERVTVALEPSADQQPYVEFVTGDSIEVNGSSLRVTSLTAAPDIVGQVRWAIEVASGGTLAEERLDHMLKAKISGTVGGRSLAAGPIEPKLQGTDYTDGRSAQIPSLSSYGDAVAVGSAGVQVAEAPYRITGLVVTSPGDGTSPTTIRVRNLTRATSAVVSIGATEEEARLSTIIDVSMGDRVELDCVAAGGHSKINATLRVYRV